MKTNKRAEPTRAREPVTWGDVEAANRAVARRFWVYVGIVAVVIAALYGWPVVEHLAHG